ncbi:hypothetical protein FLK61_39450 [Paenalkalicoccus suaedae]|uniref:Uncharacterized protein n=1 Tax=Paenalkalicoccus suaedae TaxID=2592382 RepID=A0A859FIX5_9BACI|nr:hypothetical protein [Paenalkalicoccus suaedae]QKS72692.1 hypothetical protein FLK61_39450 [Paenalkalicoccus suaedae]
MSETDSLKLSPSYKHKVIQGSYSRAKIYRKLRKIANERYKLINYRLKGERKALFKTDINKDIFFKEFLQTNLNLYEMEEIRDYYDSFSKIYKISGKLVSSYMMVLLTSIVSLTLAVFTPLISGHVNIDIEVTKNLDQSVALVNELVNDFGSRVLIIWSIIFITSSILMQFHINTRAKVKTLNSLIEKKIKSIKQ